ncbi:helix-turn-helix transcriptional regulator [Nocardioides sp. J2M5]|uniref:ArsR/SmtB family transcription factor n=1 Tax=Nocardioides palaemonis TaxID=2829810 RepID=UPI001BA57EA9|nr:metalloregulator ArsR/SmtB family transcription factor [Nocardioides palaemonis]MBS2938893.1 helix-turn-helix transcriptional regulator [Nocardioides palaemonis]
MPLTTSPSDLALTRGASLFHGLAERNRLAILRELAGGERRVVDLTVALGMPQGTVSGHLACLRECGLVLARPEGRQMFYSIAHPELMELLGAAEQLLALTGEAVELCPNFGTTSTARGTQPTTGADDTLAP